MNTGTVIALIGNLAVLQLFYANVMKCKRIGVIKRIAFIISIVVGFIAVPLLSPLVTNIIDNTGIYDLIIKGVEILINNGSYNIVDSNSVNQSIPEWMMTLFEGAGNAAIASSSAYIAKIILRVLVFIICIAIVRLAFMIFFDASSIVSRLPIIEQFDHAFGGIYGVFEVIFVLWLILFLGLLLLGSKFIAINEFIEKIYLLKMISEYNPLVLFIKK